MKSSSLRAGISAFVGVIVAMIEACGGSNDHAGFSTEDGGLAFIGSDGDSGLCPSGKPTTITGKVYDPALNNPLYNVAVYIPAKPLEPLPRGVPTGIDACSCEALFPSGALSSTHTAVDGMFKLTNVPAGDHISLVLQSGKWRRQVDIKVQPCQDNAQPEKSLAFLGTIPAGDTNDSIPDIAVSTGVGDSLECLLFRIGLPASEYVGGTSTAGHVHVFSGGYSDGARSCPNDANGVPMGCAGFSTTPGAPASYASLWDKQADMMPYDLVLLSGEGAETYRPNPPVLEQYLNAGGRVFASESHYVWFAGSLQGGVDPPPPSDWGGNLATWNNTFPPVRLYGTVVQTLSGTNKPFPKGIAFSQWLDAAGAFDGRAPSGSLITFFETENALATKKAQAWLTDDTVTNILSFDTPVNAPAPPGGGPPSYCGRAVYAGLHVNADPGAASVHDYTYPDHPTSCAPGKLSPVEKALEFMVFDLSSCVLSDEVDPPK